MTIRFEISRCIFLKLGRLEFTALREEARYLSYGFHREGPGEVSLDLPGWRLFFLNTRLWAEGQATP